MENVRVGGVYITGDRKIVMIYHYDKDDPVFKFDGYIANINSTNSYTKHGTHFPKASHPFFDLIKEVYYSEELAEILGNPMNVVSLKAIFEEKLLPIIHESIKNVS